MAGQKEPQETVNAASEKQLFVGPWAEDGRDAYLVESMKNVTMTLNEARITGERLFQCDKPWEPPEPSIARVIKDGNVFRMYYSGRVKDPKYVGVRPISGTVLGVRSVVCYAESTDGIHWEKPNLGIAEFEGSRQNNIIVPYEGHMDKYGPSDIHPICVFIDPQAKGPEEKYKLFTKTAGIKHVEPKGGEIAENVAAEQGRISDSGALTKGLYLLTSPDGIHWEQASDDPVPTRSRDGGISLCWDERINKYVGFPRVKVVHKPYKYYKDRYGADYVEADRKAGRTTSADLLNWTKEEEIFAPDEIDNAGMPSGMTRLDYYYVNASKYTEAPQIYIAPVPCFYHWKMEDVSFKGEMFPNACMPGTGDTQFFASRDGITWNRAPGRKPFLRLGPAGTFWSCMVWASRSVIRVGDELWIYLIGRNYRHNRPSSTRDNAEIDAGFTRAVLRLDGFISADAAYTGGELTTKPMIFSGSKLQLNVDTSAGGIAQVEIQDEAGKPIEGYTLADADEINGNYIRALASWKANPNVGSLAGRTIRLRFVMRDAKLYSFQFIPEG